MLIELEQGHSLTKPSAVLTAYRNMHQIITPISKLSVHLVFCETHTHKRRRIVLSVAKQTVFIVIYFGNVKD